MWQEMMSPARKDPAALALYAPMGPTYFDLKLQYFPRVTRGELTYKSPVPRVTRGERISHLSHA